MVALESIGGPGDLKQVPPDELPDLAAQIRSFLVAHVTRTGGHLGPNLGVVELTLALHRVFDSPADALVFDTGHQAYVHKLLTGRQDFTGLRRAGGLSGYPSRAESDHDIVENSHASTALSWADGISKGYALRGEHDRRVVAVVGDGALTGGMAWEALNNIATADRPIVIVVNDNERSYGATIGGMAHHLSTLRTTQGYERFLEWGRSALQRGGTPGRLAYEALHGVKKGLKDAVAPQGLFEDLGLKYIGPVDGHDVAALEHALQRAKAFGAPVLVHAITRKGHGWAPAENDEADRFHGIGVLDPGTGRPVADAAASWTSLFADEIADIADERPDVVGITAAMLIPVGLHRFAQRHPDRVFDVGIAEQHAVASAAGLAYAGLHPVVALYATFVNRAFDQVLLDVALHRAGVTFVLDRAGVTGDDGPSHNGMWDLSLLALVPGIRIAAPRDAATLRAELREALDVDDAPTVVRFPKGAAARRRAGGRPRRWRRRVAPAGRRGRPGDRGRRHGPAGPGGGGPPRRPGHRRHRRGPPMGAAGRRRPRAARRPAPARRGRGGQRPGRWRGHGGPAATGRRGRSHAAARLRGATAVPRPRVPGAGARTRRAHRSGGLPAGRRGHRAPGRAAGAGAVRELTGRGTSRGVAPGPGGTESRPAGLSSGQTGRAGPPPSRGRTT